MPMGSFLTKLGGKILDHEKEKLADKPLAKAVAPKFTEDVMKKRDSKRGSKNSGSKY